MQIEITRSIAMADLCPKAGDRIDRPDAEARSLIDAGYAVAVKATAPAKKATSTAAKTGGEKRGA